MPLTGYPALQKKHSLLSLFFTLAEQLFLAILQKNNTLPNHYLEGIVNHEIYKLFQHIFEFNFGMVIPFILRGLFAVLQSFLGAPLAS